MLASNRKLAMTFGVVTLLITCLSATAQVPNQKQQNPLTGKYEGTVKDETGDAKLTLNIMEEAGKYSGTLTTPRGVFKIIKSQETDGVLTLEIEKPGGSSGTWTLRQSGSNVSAAFSEAGKNHTVEFRKVMADELSGEWDAVADASGQAIPFTLSLKLDGEKITGFSDSQLGHANIVSGSWKDGKLSIVLDGNVALVAGMIDGKLSGDYDYNGQGSGRWVAVRKK
jgi:hypothetical protein